MHLPQYTAGNWNDETILPDLFRLSKWWIQDFTERVPTQKVGVLTYYFANLLPKTA